MLFIYWIFAANRNEIGLFFLVFLLLCLAFGMAILMGKHIDEN